MPEIKARIFEGHKFMWDGKEYPDQEQALKALKAYQEQNFEAKLVEEEGIFHIYTRRLVKEVVVEGKS